MGTDGTLTLLVPRRHQAWHWWLPDRGDPADLAARLSPLGLRQAGRRLAPPRGPAPQEPFGLALLDCLADALLLDSGPCNAGLRREQPVDRVSSLVLPQRLHRTSSFTQATSFPLTARVAARSAGDCSFHAQLILQRWHRGPLWIAIWRCHGHHGWQRRCGPMTLKAFLDHPWQPARRSGPQSAAAVPPVPCHGP